MTDPRHSGRAEWAKIRVEQIRQHARWCTMSAVYDALHLFAWGHGQAEVHVSRAELVEITGCSDGAVRGALHGLVSRGSVVAGRGKGYYLLGSETGGCDTPACQEVTGACQEVTGACQEVTGACHEGGGGKSLRRAIEVTGACHEVTRANAPPNLPEIQRDRQEDTERARARACALDAVERKTESPGPPANPVPPPTAAPPRPGDNGSGRPPRDPATPSNATPRIVAGVDAETATAVDRLLDMPGWLSGLNRLPERQKARSLELVRAYAAAGHDPATVELWIRAARHPRLEIASPPAWVHAHLSGYGESGWAPEARSGAERKFHAALLAGDWGRAERELLRERFALAEAAATAEAAEAAQTLDEGLRADPDIAARLERLGFGVTPAAATAPPAPIRAHRAHPTRPSCDADEALVALQQRLRGEDREARRLDLGAPARSGDPASSDPGRALPAAAARSAGEVTGDSGGCRAARRKPP